MKIIIDLSTFTATHCGGKDEVAYNLLRGFSAQGHASQIICVCTPELSEIVRKIDERYEIIELERRVASGKLSVLRSTIMDIGYGFRLNRIIKEKQAKCLFYTNKLSPCMKLACKTVLLPHDIQFIVRYRENRKKTRSDVLSHFLYGLSFSKCDRIIAISDFDRKEMIRYFPKLRSRIDRIYNPIRFKDCKRNEKKDYITAINIQWPHKNIETLIRAYAELSDDIDEKLILVGKKTDWQMMNLEELIKTHGLEDRVIFTGFVDDEQLCEIISRTRVYVNPSLFEGFGMTAIEMMGSRVPTIVSNSTANPETTLGLCRYYEPPTDHKALAAQILDELQHPTDEQRLAKLAERVREEYDYINISKKYWDYLNEVSSS